MNDKGHVIVEFAVAAFLLFTLLFAVVDVSMMFYVNLTMQQAVRDATRYVITGPPGNTQDALKERIRAASNGYYEQNVSKDALTVSLLTPADTKNASNYTGVEINGGSTGAPGQIIIVSLPYSWHLMTPMLQPFFADGNYSFTARATMKNENWGQP